MLKEAPGWTHRNDGFATSVVLRARTARALGDRATALSAYLGVPTNLLAVVRDSVDKRREFSIIIFVVLVVPIATTILIYRVRYENAESL